MYCQMEVEGLRRMLTMLPMWKGNFEVSPFSRLKKWEIWST